MIASRLFYSLFLPLTIWLLYGAPSLLLTGNLVLVAVVVLHLYALIWYRYLFKFFGGNEFTYAPMALGINISSFFSTFTSGLLTFWILGKNIEDFRDISPLAWGFICTGFLVTFALPVSSTRHVAPLPKASQRREFENPLDGKK